ncbi:MAG: HAMP domain-containing sensor histidine kinase [Pseudomonadota bacterium]
MGSLSISRQIQLAVGCALVLLAALAGLSYLATSELSSTFTGYRGTAQQTLLANELLEEFFDAEIAALSYRLNPTRDEAKTVRGLLDKISQKLSDAERSLAGDEQALNLLRQVSASARDYQDTFARVTGLTARSDRIGHSVKAIGPRIRAKLTTIMNFARDNGDAMLGHEVGIAQQEVMRGRFYNERFLLTNDPQTFDTAVTIMDGARQHVRSFQPYLQDPEMQKLAIQVIDHISAYINAAGELSTVIVVRNDIRDGRLEDLGLQVRDRLRNVHNGAVDRQREMGATGFERSRTTLFLVVSLSLAALCSGAALGGLVSRHISGNVRKMAETMSEIAGGNLEVPITGAERKHELGMMARALQVFKENAGEVRRALEREREVNGMQRQFVSMVSHEFRTPLAIIDGNAQRLLRRSDQLTVQRVSKVVGSIRTSVLRLTDLMESVLCAARLEEGRIKFEPSAFDLGDMIAEVCRNYADINTSHKIEIDIDTLPDSWHGDVKLLRQVVSNLVSNAVKYSPDSTRILVRGELAPDGAAVISVEDEGVGIPPDELEKLFERFFRASTSTGISGSGIGLHLVKHLVELHEGKMDVRSVVGQGTTFEVHLPAPKATSLEDLEIDYFEAANDARNPQVA